MKRSRLHFLFVAIIAARLSAPAAVSFNREVRPILAENCFECHGPAKAKGKTRLDVEGKADLRELLRRIKTEDAEDQMPPKDSGKARLTEKQIGILEQWISNGAPREGHWAFAKVVRPEIPSLAKNPIDAFLRKRLAEAGLQPEPRAADRVLSRRLAFDLAGLPPAPGSSAAPDNWEADVERYLAAPEFGERMAVWWLDLVRYADSEGYFSDLDRNIYPYRDYVIASFNANKRFDQFTIEQLAGDLLPGAGWEQKIASGYNRLPLTTHESGANAAEYRARYAADRVRNLGSVWLGLTLGCAQCHDHKFDPISSRDFYRTAAFFADIKEEAVLRQEEVFVRAQSPEYRELIEQTKAIERIFQAGVPEQQCAQVLMEAEALETNRRPANWPKSKKTDDMMEVIRKRADGAATPAECEALDAYFKRHFFRDLNAQLLRVQRARSPFETNIASTLITEAGPVRAVRTLARGNWMDEASPQVAPGFLPIGPAMTNSLETLNRLDLARWVMAPENPLTARVAVNRLWELFFGSGLVESMDDFGLRGEAPSQPELLDWMAAELIASGWDLKAMIRLIVTSQAYQRSAAASLEARQHDPRNRLFGRQNRISLAAEFMRDNALAISGLLSNGHGGPPVKTYLPADYLKTVDTRDEEPYEADHGERLYRRGVYLHRKRAAVHPALAAFNASSRAECVSRRTEARTPQAALALLNAPQFVEAARAFAEKMHEEAAEDCGRLKAGFQAALQRDPSPAESVLLLKLLESQREEFAKDPREAARFIRIGEHPWPNKIDATELAAWTNVARAILNLEETNTRY